MAGSAPRDGEQAWEGILDPSTLRELLNLDDGATGLLVEMTGLFRADLPGRLTRLKAALAQGDAVVASEVAHALKGAAGAIGAVKLRMLASEMERACREACLPAGDPRMDGLEALSAEALQALDAFIAARGA